MEALVNITTAHCQDVLLQLLASISSRESGAELTQHGLGIKYSISARCPHCSERALEQAMAPTARGTDLLGAKPLHHVAGVAAVPAGEAEVGGAPHGHVADGALEGEALADGALGAAHLAAAVAAVHAKLNSLVGIRRTRDKLQNLSPLLSQAPAIKDFSITLLKVIKLLSVGRIQKPFVFLMLVLLPLPRIRICQVSVAEVIRRRLAPGSGGLLCVFVCYAPASCANPRI